MSTATRSIATAARTAQPNSVRLSGLMLRPCATSRDVFLSCSPDTPLADKCAVGCLVRFGAPWVGLTRCGFRRRACVCACSTILGNVLLAALSEGVIPRCKMLAVPLTFSLPFWSVRLAHMDGSWGPTSASVAIWSLLVALASPVPRKGKRANSGSNCRRNKRQALHAMTSLLLNKKAMLRMLRCEGGPCVCPHGRRLSKYKQETNSKSFAKWVPKNCGRLLCFKLF